LAQEASKQLGDLEFLSVSIFKALDPLLSKQADAAQALLPMLLEAAKADPALAEWFAKNPNPKARSLAKGGTLGAPTRANFVRESPEEQRLRLDAEAYYYHAHRLLSCLQRLPGLETVKCREIEIVRNQLLEHPEKKDSQVLLPTFAYTREAGPVIKGTRSTSQAAIHPDSGFIPNSRVLAETLIIALSTAITRIKAPTTPSAAT